LETSFSGVFLSETQAILKQIDVDCLERMAHALAAVRDAGGRLFVLGVGGSAAHASHAVNDFRKLCGFEAYAPTDNVSELTARINDEGWETVFERWLQVSRLGPQDALLVLSETKVTADVIAAAKDLRFVGRAGAGVDNIDLKAASQSGIVVANVPGGNTISACEQALALMFALAAQLENPNPHVRPAVAKVLGEMGGARRSAN